MAWHAGGKTSRAHIAYIFPEGWSPSFAIKDELLAAWRETRVTSIYRAPSRSVSPRLTALKLSIAPAMAARSRSLAKGVTPQSGIDRTSTREANPRQTRWTARAAPQSADDIHRGRASDTDC